MIDRLSMGKRVTATCEFSRVKAWLGMMETAVVQQHDGTGWDRRRFSLRYVRLHGFEHDHTSPLASSFTGGD
jgi:hypothetical protein